MTGAIKISAVSTISYDTFSCTLEGFDDPSDTMKAIIVYFHDLAADNDDTDGNPRMPDVDVLTMLAERETNGSVEVEINDNSIVLNAVVKTAGQDDASATHVLDAPTDEYDDMQDDAIAELEDAQATEEAADPEGTTRDEGSFESITPVDETVANDVLAADDRLAEEEEEEEEEDVDEFEGADELDVFDDTAAEEMVKEALEDDTAETGEEDAPQEPVDDIQLTDTDESAVSPQGTSIQQDVLHALGETNLSDEDKADLAAELAEVEVVETVSEDDPVEEHADTDRGIGKTLRLDRANRTLHEKSGAGDEDSVSRLMDKAAEQLGDTEITRRRSAFSHLRAAMAATVADRKFKPKTHDDTFGDTDDAKAYRNDLADAVAPKLSKDVEDVGEMDTPTPLVLDSGQRLDDDEVETPMPVIAPPPPEPKTEVAAPLQETAQELAPEVEGDLGVPQLPDDSKNTDIDAGFAAFAKKMGATKLIDLLEAAAAYTTYVEGHAQFARPQVMRQVSNIPGMNRFSREDSLLSFGLLLRQGKIVRAAPGQFQVADTTRFKPEAEQ